MTKLSSEQIKLLKAGASNKQNILSPSRRMYSPHGLYGYPARFSPYFASSAIEAISTRGESILDPFMGSGTTVIEAIRSGRSSLGVDISPISGFINDRLFRDTPVATLNSAVVVANRLAEYLRARDSSKLQIEEELLSLLNMGDESLRHIAAPLVFIVKEARSENGEVGKLLRAFALSSGQWALDGRKRIPSKDEFLDRFEFVAQHFSSNITSFSQACQERWGSSSWHHFAQRRIGDSRLVLHREGSSGNKFDGLVTSPPYPGVHMLYGKWQILGRKETRAPQWIVGAKDLLQDSDFTLGPRRSSEEEYFRAITEVFEATRPLLKDGALSVHMVGFSKPESQVMNYVKSVEAAGFREVNIADSESSDGRIWRSVPSRKFYAQSNNAAANTSKEVCLVFTTKTQKKPE